ncbi:MAG: lipocalin family protein [Pyrinomonadaceae bacterium]
MHLNLDLQSIWNAFSGGAAAAFDALADLIHGDPENLRDGTEFDPVKLPRDLAAHSGVQTEWWYYTGHLSSASGRRFGFELVFFKRRTDLDRFAVVPLRLLGNPIHFAHFAVTDLDRGTFKYAHRKSSNGRLESPAAASEEHLYLSLGDWSVRESRGSHLLRASLEGCVLELTLTPAKPVVLNGRNGVSFKDEGQASRYFSYTRMIAEGDILVGGRVERVGGSAWMDREFGTWEPTENQKGWDWFSIQMDDDTELMCYQLRRADGSVSSYSSGSFVDRDGQVTPLVHRDFSITPLGTWTSPRSGASYPSRWRVAVPKLGLELDIEPVLADQELDTRGTTMIVYWEGACVVGGNRGGKPVGGRAYVELVGYDRSHEQPNLAYFLMGDRVDLVRRIIGTK